MSHARTKPEATPVEELDTVALRLCGDSGDGMQLAGALLARASVRMGNSVAYHTDYPAEIRAPAGTLPGVSGCQIQISRFVNAAPGDRLHALVAMNPAALAANLRDLQPGGLLIVNRDSFTPTEIAKAGFSSDPLSNGSLAGFRVLDLPVDSLNRTAPTKSKLSLREVDRSKNFFILGFLCWVYGRALEPIVKWNRAKFSRNPEALAANIHALKAGHHHAESPGLLPVRYCIPRAPLPPGQYRHLTGIEGVMLGLRAAARLAQRSLVFSTAPTMPASDLLQPLLETPASEVRALATEDEPAAAGIALGAAFAGSIGAVATSGPGLSQTADMIGLAVMAELPLVVVHVQRGGPSTGLPTKTEQADLLTALNGRNGECPLPILAPTSPTDCFHMAVEAVRLACRAMTPVIVLVDLHLMHGSEPWRIPTAADLPLIEVPREPTPFQPYARDENQARPWAAAGTPGREHRLGGLEKEPFTGAVSYDPIHHEIMCGVRAEKIVRLAETIPDLTVEGPTNGDLLVLGWGSTAGALSAAAERCRAHGQSVAHAQLRYLNPFPRNLGEILRKYRIVLVPELNGGQLLQLLRARFLVDAVGLSKLQGRPFLTSEIEERVAEILKGAGVT